MNRIFFRSLFYFRTGYIEYFVFVITILNMLTTTYYLAIKNYPPLTVIFPSFFQYVVIILIVIVPIMLLIGYTHTNKTSGLSSEIEIFQESNPYTYILTPGIFTECLAPLYLELLKTARTALTDEKIILDQDTIDELESKLDLLRKGESLPKPKNWDRWLR